MRGDEGRGRLAAVQRELVARRCLMATQLARVLRVGPITGERLQGGRRA